MWAAEYLNTEDLSGPEVDASSPLAALFLSTTGGPIYVKSGPVAYTKVEVRVITRKVCL